MIPLLCLAPGEKEIDIWLLAILMCQFMEANMSL